MKGGAVSRAARARVPFIRREKDTNHKQKKRSRYIFLSHTLHSLSGVLSGVRGAGGR